MANINIFYSWQSDLPNSDNRNFIQSCIDDAVKSLRDTVCIEADRDTKGEYGSPDISEVIFKKIEQSDIFIADVSIINSEVFEKTEEGEFIKIQKYSPNPNVLLELGYAAGVIGWGNIICIMNEDYGKPEQMPFDLEHRRLTPYSFKKKQKSEVKKEIRNLISDTVMNLIENGVRAKNGMAAYQIGSYINSEIIPELRKFEPTQSVYYLRKTKEWKEKCTNLIRMIKEIEISKIKTEEDEALSVTESLNSHHLKIISNDVQQFYNTLIREFTEEVVDDNFWELGNLRVESDVASQTNEYVGNDDEKNKINLIEELKITLAKLNLYNMYWQTFNELYILPLAICNISKVSDTQISLYIKVENESAKVVWADKNLIDTDLKGIEGLIYKCCGLKEILMMPIDEHINYEEDISYSINDDIANAKRYYNNYLPFGRSMPEYDEEDYEREIKKYFAEPIDKSKDSYEFYIKSLRPNEKIWIGPSLLLKPLKDEVVLSYTLKSNKTDGNISGMLKCKISL